MTPGGPPRFFVEHKRLALSLVVVTLAWGVAGYVGLPRRQNPPIVVGLGTVVCPWPGASAPDVELRLTRRLEEVIGRHRQVAVMGSVSRDNVAAVRFVLDERLRRPGPALDAIERDVTRITDLPAGAGPARVTRDLGEAAALMLVVSGPIDAGGQPKYALADLRGFVAVIAGALERQPSVRAVRESGLPREEVSVQPQLARLAASGVSPASLAGVLAAHTASPDRAATVNAPVFESEAEIGGTMLGFSPSGLPVRLADIAEIRRGLAPAPQVQNFLTRRGVDGAWRRAPAATLAVEMVPAARIDDFAAATERALRSAGERLPPDVVVARISDQAEQVRERLGLFARSLYEAIGLVLLVAVAGFLSWRGALLVAAAIPLTLALTFGLMWLAGLDLQQVSTASLILALGLLVDDPVVAADAIEQELGRGAALREAAWRGPVRLSNAILFATITNIVAYAPLLLVSGNTGRFIFSLPLVMAFSLAASRAVSMTFIPHLSQLLLRPPRAAESGRRARVGAWFARRYNRSGSWAIRHRGAVICGGLVLFGAGAVLFGKVRPQFFPQESSRLFYVDVWRPDGATVAETGADAERVERAIRRVVEASNGAHTGGEDKRLVVEDIVSYVGGGAPRFWFAFDPTPPLPNYAQIVVRLAGQQDMTALAAPLQRELSRAAPGALVDVRELEIGEPFGVPIQIRVVGDDLAVLRSIAGEVKEVVAALPEARRVREDWVFARPADVAPDAAEALTLGEMRDQGRRVPVVVRFDAETASLWRAFLAPQVASAAPTAPEAPFLLRRRNGARTVTVSCFPAPGLLASETLRAARPRLDQLAAALPPGYRLEFGGEHEAQIKGFRDLALALGASVALIYATLALQFRSGVKPLLVFAGIPFGVVGSLAALWLMRAPFGFMAFLGIASLIGVVVSHMIVLFDGIEELRAAGGIRLEEALLAAGRQRLRPVLITVAATICALIPLAARGGPLWAPLCYAQIGGLAVATVVTLLLAPVLYAVFVRDLKLIRW